MSCCNKKNHIFRAQMLILPYKHRSEAVQSHKVQKVSIVVPNGYNSTLNFVKENNYLSLHQLYQIWHHFGWSPLSSFESLLDEEFEYTCISMEKHSPSSWLNPACMITSQQMLMVRCCLDLNKRFPILSIYISMNSPAETHEYKMTLVRFGSLLGLLILQHFGVTRHWPYT